MEPSNRTIGHCDCEEEMSQGFFGKVLKPFGLYRVNADYIKAERKDLSEINASLAAASRAVDSGSQVVSALKSDSPQKAVSTILKIAAPDDQSIRLKEAQVRLQGGEELKAVIAAVRSPELGEEIAGALRRVVEESQAAVERGRFDLEVVDEKLNRKVLELETAAEDWSLGEKLATPDAVRAILKKASEARSRAVRIEEKLTGLGKAVDELKG